MRRIAILLGCLSLAACYRPTIGDGAFRCGPGGLCPDGYVCNALMMCAAKGGSADLGGDTGPLFNGRLGPLDLTGITGTLQCSTKTGEIKVAVGVEPAMQIVPPSADGFTIVPQSSGPQVAIWSFSRVAIPAGITVKPIADSEAIPVFASVSSLDVEGSIDWRGYGGLGDLAGKPGAGRMSGVDSGGQAGMGDGGGGGGGHAEMGAMGQGTGGGAGGLPVGTPDLVPVHTGSGGGGGGNAGGRGGNGGGSLVLIAAGDLTVGGKLDVSGQVGLPGNSVAGGGGGGGGSGGSILLSGRNVNLNSGHELVARGGPGGAGMGTGAAGGDGSPGRIWIGGTLSVSGALMSDPMPTQSPTPVASFPQ